MNNLDRQYPDFAYPIKVKFQITPTTTIILAIGEDENGRQYIEFAGARYYKEQK